MVPITAYATFCRLAKVPSATKLHNDHMQPKATMMQLLQYFIGFYQALLLICNLKYVLSDSFVVVSLFAIKVKGSGKMNQGTTSKMNAWLLPVSQKWAHKETTHFFMN